MNEWSRRNAPRWVLAIVTGPEEADDIAGRVDEARLPPQPALIGRKLGELEASGNQASNPGVEIGALEVHDEPGGRYGVPDRMDRKGGVAIRALKACVAGRRVDDERQAHVAIERDGPVEVGNGKRHLVQVHENLCLRPNVLMSGYPWPRR